MIKKILSNICIWSICSLISASHHSTLPNNSQSLTIDNLYEKLKQQHEVNQKLIQELSPLINTIPTRPGTENSKKIFKELESQISNFSWYMTYPTGWTKNRESQEWSQTELENLIKLKKADCCYLQTILFTFSEYAKQESN